MDSKQHNDDIPERMDYRVLAESDGSDGESLTIVQAWYWPGQPLPGDVDAISPHGDSRDDLRRDLEAMLAALDRPPLIEERDGRVIEGEY
jgi:hypothetical protein